MKLQFDTKNFKKKIDSVGRAARKNNLQTILSNICFRVSNNQIEMIGTDTQLFVKERMNAEQDLGYSEFLLPASKLQEIVSVTKSNEIDISFDGNKCQVKAGSSRFNLNLPEMTGYPHGEEDWSNLPYVSFTIDATDLFQSLSALSLTTNAVVKQAGVHFELKSNRSGLRITSTDTVHCGIYLSKLNAHCDATNSGFYFVVPSSTAETLIGSLRGYEGNVEVQFISLDNYGKIRFKFDTTTIQSALANSSRFPYEDLAPKNMKDLDANFVFKPEDLSQAVKEVGVVNDDVSPSILFKINQESLTLYGADSKEGTEGDTKLSLETGADEPFDIKLDGKRLAQGLRAVQMADCDHYRFMYKRFLNIIGYTKDGEMKIIYALLPQHNGSKS